MPLYPAAQNFTTGSIPFGGTNSLLTQDNTNLFWDDTNNKLRVTTDNATSGFEIISDNAAANPQFTKYQSVTGAMTNQMRKARGSLAAPRRALSGDVLGGMSGTGAEAVDNATDATFNTSAPGGQLRWLAAEDFTATGHGASTRFATTDIGSTTVTERLRIEPDGRIYALAIHNSAGAVTGTATQYLASGTYTPTLTNVTNLAASTAYVAQWMRVGNVVTVSGKVDVDPTIAGLCQLGMSLPIASNLANAEDCAGTANASGVAGQCAAILADAANDRAEMNWIAADITNQAMYYIYTYEVL